MGIKIARKKPKQLWLSILYRISKLPFASSKTKMKLFLNLEWAFHRFAHENSFKLYNELNHPVRAKTRIFLMDLISSNDKVLDLGCKKGVMSNYLAEKAAKVVGIDYDGDAIGIAKSNYSKPNLKFIKAEALEFLKTNKETFNVLILSHILEHLDNPLQFLNDFKGYFKYIYIEVPDFEKNYLNIYRSDLNLSLIYSDADHISEFDRNDLIDLIEKNGLRILVSEFRYGVQKFWCQVM